MILWSRLPDEIKTVGAGLEKEYFVFKYVEQESIAFIFHGNYLQADMLCDWFNQHGNSEHKIYRNYSTPVVGVEYFEYKGNYSDMDPLGLCE